MRYGIIGDIHGNLEALKAVLDALDAESCDGIYCLGDTIGYGANPTECLRIIRDRAIRSVVGNHDLAAIDRFDLTFFNSAAREAAVYAIQKLAPADLKYIASLPLTLETDQFTLVHSSPTRPENFDYIFTLVQAQQAFENLDTSLTFIGHSHVPVVFFHDPGVTDYAQASEFYLKRGRKIIFNCGSVGQPRDGNPHASYAILDTNIAKIRLERIPYDVDTAAKKIIDADLPLILAERLYKGY